MFLLLIVAIDTTYEKTWVKDFQHELKLQANKQNSPLLKFKQSQQLPSNI